MRPTGMKLAPVLAALLLLVTACGTDGGGSAEDPAPTTSQSPTSSPATGRIPAAPGEVTTRNLATVMDTGRPELCLGPVAESYPPQCHGIPLEGWDWSARHGTYDTSGDVRWGQYAVTGTFDGTTMTVTGAIPAAAYDPATTDGLRPGDAGSGAVDLRQVRQKLAADPLPGTLSVSPTPEGVLVQVVHDDGSLQERVDAGYGAGVVKVISMLVPVNR
ncbi:hypothetical protein GCM10027601_05380 [Nocardioides ungokensis]